MLKRVRLLLVTAVVGGWAAAQPLARPASSARNYRTFPAITEGGRSEIPTSDLRVDLIYASGKTDKGRLFVIFDPATGFFYEAFVVAEPADGGDYPQYDLIDVWKRIARVGVTTDRLFLVGFGNGVQLMESSEKAANLDDAEAKSLKWVTNHLTEIEGRSGRFHFGRSQSLSGSRHSDFPAGFFKNQYSSFPPQVNLVEILPIFDPTRNEKCWDLILQNPENQHKARLTIYPKETRWLMTRIREY